MITKINRLLDSAISPSICWPPSTDFRERSCQHRPFRQWFARDLNRPLRSCWRGGIWAKDSFQLRGANGACLRCL